MSVNIQWHKWNGNNTGVRVDLQAHLDSTTYIKIRQKLSHNPRVCKNNIIYDQTVFVMSSLGVTSKKQANILRLTLLDPFSLLFVMLYFSCISCAHASNVQTVRSLLGQVLITL